MRRIGGTEGGCHDSAVLFVAQRKSDTAARAAERRRRAQSSYARFSLGGDAGDEELSRKKGEGSDAATIGFSGVRPHRRRYRAPGVLQPPALPVFPSPMVRQTSKIPFARHVSLFSSAYCCRRRSSWSTAVHSISFGSSSSTPSLLHRRRQAGQVHVHVCFSSCSLHDRKRFSALVSILFLTPGSDAARRRDARAVSLQRSHGCLH